MIKSTLYIPAQIVIDMVPPTEISVPVELLQRLLTGTVVKEELKSFIPEPKKIRLTNGTKVKLKVNPNCDKHFICPQFVSSDNEIEIEKIDKMPQSDHVRIVLTDANTKCYYEGSIANIVDVLDPIAESEPEANPEPTNQSSDGEWLKWDEDNDDGPTLSYVARVQVKFKNGEVSEPDYVGAFNWGIYDYEYDIEFYRIVND